MKFISLLNTVITLALLLGIGFIARKKELIDDASSKKLSLIIVRIGQPALIISSLISLEYSNENLKRGLFMLALSLGMHMFMAIIAYAFSKCFRENNERKISEFAIVFTNCGFIGFPIISSLYGDEGLFCAAFYLIGFHLFTWTWGIFILSRGRDDIKLTLKKILINYGTVPSLIGFILFLLPFRLPPFAVDFASYLAGLCTPISMLITGALLATRSPKQVFGTAGNYIVCAVRLLIVPMAVCLLLRLIGMDSFYIVFGTVMAAMPSAAIVTMFGEMYSISPGYASQLVGVTSLFCTVTLPIMMLFAEFVAG